MKKTIRDALSDLEISLCKMADLATGNAKSSALKSLDGDTAAELEARKLKAKADAYMLACEKVEDLRRAVESGEVIG